MDQTPSGYRSQPRRRPLIGICTYRTQSRDGGFVIEGQLSSYQEAVWQSGGQPVLIPTLQFVNGPALFEDIWNVLLPLDGILLAGGTDVEAGYFDELPHPQSQAPDYYRDAWEFMVARIALARHLPVLGICRGAQLMNAACGGTLWQDLRDRQDVSNQVFRAHSPRRVSAHTFQRCTIHFDAASSMSATLRMPHSLDVYCLHHQAVRELAPIFRPCATSDGFCHAFERRDSAFGWGIQFHAEEDIAQEWSQRLFRIFTQVCARTQQGDDETLYMLLRPLLDDPDVTHFHRFICSAKSLEERTARHTEQEVSA